MVEVSFGEWLKRRRKAEGLTQEQLAEQVGCSTITMRKIEAEERRPSGQIVERLAGIFQIPSNEQTAFLRFARGDWKSAPSLKTGDAPWRAPTAITRSNLPASLTSLVGRGQDIAKVREYLSNEDIRLVTLIGPPGIGKTRLSMEVARTELSDFPAGVFFVALAPIQDPVLIAPTIGQTLGFVEVQNRSPFDRLRDGIGEKQMLIVLDNCEHLVEGVALLASDLLSACPRLKIVNTSRESLRVPGEWLYPVPTLNIPMVSQLQSLSVDEVSQYTALELFAQRARAVRADFTVNIDNLKTVATICAQLDGLPLAIELIAARVRLMSPQSLLSNLTDQFTLYADGVRAVSNRQKTLHNAIGWSYDLLPAKEQILFRRLAVFAGGWSSEAAQMICSGEGSDVNEIPDLLMHLADKSLIILQEENGENRFHILETIRQYAREKLWAAREGERMCQRHLAYFLNLAERAEPHLRAFDMVIWLDRLDTNLDNIRSALRWALQRDIEATLRLASALLWYWHIRRSRREGCEWLERGLSIETKERGNQLITADRAKIRGKALNAIGSLMVMTAELGKAPAHLEESLALFRGLGSAGKRGMAYALLRLSELSSTGSKSESLLTQSLTMFREVGDKFGVAECLIDLTANALEDDDYKQAIIFAEEHLALRREIGDQDGTAMALSILGDLASSQDDYQRATAFHRESVAIFRELGNKWATCVQLSNVGDDFLWQSNYQQATKHYEEALAFAQDIGARFLMAFNSYNFGTVAWFQGNYERATQMISDCLATFQEVGHHWAVVGSLHALGEIALAQGNEEKAAEWYEAELTLGQAKQLDLSILFELSGLGLLAWAKGDYELATRRFEEGLTLSHEPSLKPGRFHALYGLGQVAKSRGDHVAACSFYAKALETQQHRITPPFTLKWAWRRGTKSYGAAIAYPIDAFAVLSVVQSQIGPFFIALRKTSTRSPFVRRGRDVVPSFTL